MPITIDQVAINLIRKFLRKLADATPKIVIAALENPLTTTEVLELFTEVRWHFGLVPLRLVLMRHKAFMDKIGMATVAAVGSGEVSINLDYLDALRRKRGEGAGFMALLAALVHENGHPYIPYRSPGTFRNKMDDAKRVGNMLGDKKAIALMSLLNIVYDTFIDVFSHDRMLYDPREVLHCFEAKYEEEREAKKKLVSKVAGKLAASLPGIILGDEDPRERGYIGQYLISFRQYMMGVDFGICEIEKPALDVATKAVKMIRATEGETAKIEEGIVTLSRWITELQTSEPDPDDGEGDDEEGKGEGEGKPGKGKGKGKPGKGDPGEGESQEGDGDSEDGDDSEGGKPGKPKPGKPGKGKPKKGKSSKLTPEELKKLAEAIQEAMEELGMEGESSTAEDLDDNPLEKKLEAVDIGDEGDRDMAAKLLEFSSDDAAFHFLWTIAAQKVKLQPPLGVHGEGTVYSAANVPWQLGMPLKDLDIRSTIETGGRFLPGITTVQPHYVPGPGVPQPGTSPRIMGSFDTSGSMQQESPVRKARNLDTVLITCFAMIHEAKRRKTPVAMNLFADYNFYIDWSRDYEKVARQLYDNVNASGWGNSCTGLEKCQPHLKAGDLLIYATDYELCGSEKAGAVALQRLLADGVNITFIAMFRHCAKEAGIPFVECQTLADLEKVALKSISSTNR